MAASFREAGNHAVEHTARMLSGGLRYLLQRETRCKFEYVVPWKMLRERGRAGTAIMMERRAVGGDNIHVPLLILVSTCKYIHSR